MKIKCPNKEKMTSKTGLDHDKWGQAKMRCYIASVIGGITVSPLLCRTWSVSLYLPRFLHSQWISDKGNWNTSVLRLNHNSGSNSSLCDKYFFFWHSRNQFEFLCSVHANIPSSPSPPKKTVIKAKKWNMRSRTHTPWELGTYRGSSPVTVFKQTAAFLFYICWLF